MTEVNYAEVRYMIRRKDGDAAWKTIAGELVAAPIQFHPADRPLADTAADFKARCGISLADAFATALAKEKKAETGHRPPEVQAAGERNKDQLAKVTIDQRSSDDQRAEAAFVSGAD
jgi:PIN domain